MKVSPCSISIAPIAIFPHPPQDVILLPVKKGVFGAKPIRKARYKTTQRVQSAIAAAKKQYQRGNGDPIDWTNVQWGQFASDPEQVNGRIIKLSAGELLAFLLPCPPSIIWRSIGRNRLFNIEVAFVQSWKAGEDYITRKCECWAISEVGAPVCAYEHKGKVYQRPSDISRSQVGSAPTEETRTGSGLTFDEFLACA